MKKIRPFKLRKTYILTLNGIKNLYLLSGDVKPVSIPVLSVDIVLVTY